MKKLIQKIILITSIVISTLLAQNEQAIRKNVVN